MLVTFSTDTEFYDLNILTAVALRENPFEENPDYVLGVIFYSDQFSKIFFPEEGNRDLRVPGCCPLSIR